jgi:murein DD-endopeptidase MepM/ murein hydrolase activator NlpD
MRLAVLTLTLALAGLGLQAAPNRSSKKTGRKPVSGAVHVIRKGETAAKVARAHGLSLTELAALNPGKSLSNLPVGAHLILRRAPGSIEATPRKEAGGAAVSRPALAALPGTPIVAPLAMPHLEQLLPYQLRGSAPTDGPVSAMNLQPHQTPSTTAQLLARIQQVLPPVSEAELNALLPTFASADRDRLDLLWPVETRTISSTWGPRMRTKTIRVKNQRKKRVRYRGRHKGVDLAAPTGTAVFAAMDGQVVIAGRHKQYGNYIVLDHGNGVNTVYAHHSLNLVHAGDIVHRGQKIAEVGRTGNATGPHLHFELRLDGLQRNPLPVLNDEEEIPAEMAAQNALMGTSSFR